MEELLVSLVVSVHLFLKLTLLSQQLLFVKMTKLFTLSSALHLHFIHFVIYLFVSFVVVPFLLFNLPFKFLYAVFVLFEFFLGLSLNIRFLLSDIFSKTFYLRLNFVTTLFFN